MVRLSVHFSARLALAAVGTVCLALPALPAGAASSATSPAPARPPDLSVRAVASHGPGTPASGRPMAIPVRKGPHTQGQGRSVPKAPSSAFTRVAAISAGAVQQGLGANGVTPSDSTGAIGPIHYIEMVNTQVGLFDRSLTSQASAPLATFVGASGGAAVGDGQIQWDQEGGRWLYASLEEYSNFTNDFLAFGWSKGGDTSALTLASSVWCNFHLPTGTDLHDFAKLGHDANFILIGTNVYANAASFTSSAIWAIPKPAAGDVSCTPPIAKEFVGTAINPLKHLPPDSNIVFTPVPTNAADGAATGYVVSIDPAFIGVWHVSPSMVGACTTPPCLVADGEIGISPWNPAGATDYLVPQPGGNPNIDALDGRLTQAVQHGDPGAAGAETVWTQHTTQDASGRTVVTWYELNPSVCSAGLCLSSARRQEGVLANPNLYLFNAAISPTSHGDAAIIHYNTGSLTTFNDVRAQGRGAGDPLGAMTGELVLRGSTVAENDFSCFSQVGPPCRWGDYAGASPDPTSCSVVWGTSMLSGDIAAGGTNRSAPTWVTQNFALDEGRVRSVVSTQQYVLPGSDGRTWVDMDSARLSLASAPCTDSTGLISANADLFTSSAGVNQDIGVFVDVDGSSSATPLAWKESGGFNGTFSPNAAYVQALFPMPAGHVYTVRLKWKANAPTSGFIYAGAGPISPGGYSPARLTVQLLQTAPPPSTMTSQQKSTGSDGATWTPIPGLGSLSLAPSVDSRVVLGGSADLWTDTAGFNQDIGIQISGGAFGLGQVVAWKESGGFAGTFSPNAAFVQATANLNGLQPYVAQLVWKTNRPAPPTASIYAGAGPLPTTTAYSPTSLIATVLPSGPNPYESVSTTQAALTNNDGIQWTAMAPQVVVTPTVSTYSIVSANADLWTARSGFNQDFGVFVYDNAAPAQLLVWKESGGFGGTFSPNAAFAETVFPMVGGHTYRFLLVWKTNRNASGTGATIYAGAGPIAGQFSPTRLAVDLVS